MQIYIINENEHLGPYDQEDLFSMYKSSKIDLTAIIWVKSSNRKMTYKDYLAHISVRVEPIVAIPDRPEIPIMNKPRKRYELFLMPLALVVSVSFLFFNQNKLQKPEGMKKSSFKEFEQFLSSDTSVPDFTVKLNSDLSSIWILTKNLKKPFSIKAVSINKKILASQRVEFKSNSIRDSRKINKIETFNFVQGKKIVEGIYNVTLISGEIKKSKNILLSPSRGKAFRKKLSSFHYQRGVNQKEFHIEIKQKYITLISLAKEISQKIRNLEVLSSDQLKSMYEKKYGPIFTSFVITNEDDFKQILKKRYSNNDLVFSEYFKLSNTARKFGRVASMGISKKISLNEVVIELERYIKQINSR